MSDRPGRAAPEEPGQEPTTSDWKAVDRSGDGPKPPLPSAVKWGGLALLAALSIAALVIGIALGGGFRRPEPTPSPTPSPELKMEAPIQVGDYVRGEVSSADPASSAESLRQVSANYSDGTASLLFMMVWPQSDLETFMSDAGVEATASPTPTPTGSPSASPTASASPEPQVLCGKAIDTDTLACGTIVRGTGLMVAALSDQEEEEIRGLLADFEQAVTP